MTQQNQPRGTPYAPARLRANTQQKKTTPTRFQAIDARSFRRTFTASVSDGW